MHYVSCLGSSLPCLLCSSSSCVLSFVTAKTPNIPCCVLPHHPQERTAGLALQQQTGTGPPHQQRHGQSPAAAAAHQHQQQRVEVVASLCHHVCAARQQLVVVLLRVVVMTAGGMRVILGEGPLVGATCLPHGVVVVVAAGGDVWGCMSLVLAGRVPCRGCGELGGWAGCGSSGGGVCLVAYGVCLGGLRACQCVRAVCWHSWSGWHD